MMRTAAFIVVFMASTVPAFAHHGGGTFDLSKSVTYTGKLTTRGAGQSALVALLRRHGRERARVAPSLRDALGARVAPIGLVAGAVSGRPADHRRGGARQDRSQLVLPQHDQVRERQPHGSVRPVREGAGRCDSEVQGAGGGPEHGAGAAASHRRAEHLGRLGAGTGRDGRSPRHRRRVGAAWPTESVQARRTSRRRAAADAEAPRRPGRASTAAPS